MPPGAGLASDSSMLAYSLLNVAYHARTTFSGIAV